MKPIVALAIALAAVFLVTSPGASQVRTIGRQVLPSGCQSGQLPVADGAEGWTCGASTPAAGSVTNTMLAGSIAAAKFIGTDIVTVGNVGTGTWSAPFSGLTRVAALSGPLTLTTSSTPGQSVDPNGSDRDINLPTAAVNLRFDIKHRGAANVLTIKDSGGTTVTTLVAGQSVTVWYDGTAWNVW